MLNFLRTFRQKNILKIALFGALLIAGGSVWGTDYTWNPNSSKTEDGITYKDGGWQKDANWSGSGRPDDAGDKAIFSNNSWVDVSSSNETYIVGTFELKENVTVVFNLEYGSNTNNKLNLNNLIVPASSKITFNTSGSGSALSFPSNFDAANIQGTFVIKGPGAVDLSGLSAEVLGKIDLSDVTGTIKANADSPATKYCEFQDNNTSPISFTLKRLITTAALDVPYELTNSSSVTTASDGTNTITLTASGNFTIPAGVTTLTVTFDSALQPGEYINLTIKDPADPTKTLGTISKSNGVLWNGAADALTDNISNWIGATAENIADNFKDTKIYFNNDASLKIPDAGYFVPSEINVAADKTVTLSTNSTGFLKLDSKTGDGTLKVTGTGILDVTDFSGYASESTLDLSDFNGILITNSSTVYWTGFTDSKCTELSNWAITGKSGVTETEWTTATTVVFPAKAHNTAIFDENCSNAHPVIETENLVIEAGAELQVTATTDTDARTISILESFTCNGKLTVSDAYATMNINGADVTWETTGTPDISVSNLNITAGSTLTSASINFTSEALKNVTLNNGSSFKFDKKSTVDNLILKGAAAISGGNASGNLLTVTAATYNTNNLTTKGYVQLPGTTGTDKLGNLTVTSNTGSTIDNNRTKLNGNITAADISVATKAILTIADDKTVTADNLTIDSTSKLDADKGNLTVVNSISNANTNAAKIKVLNLAPATNTTVSGKIQVTDFKAEALSGKSITVNGTVTISGNLTLSGVDATHLLTVTGGGNGSFTLPASQYGGSFLSVAENGPVITNGTTPGAYTYTAEHSEIASGSSKAPDGWILSSTDMNVWLGGTIDWATAANWSKGHEPLATEVVYIPATAKNPVISSAATCLDLIIDSSASLKVESTLTIASDYTYSEKITGEGKLIVPGGKTLTVSGEVNVGIENNGTIDCSNTLAIFNKSLTFATGADFTNTGKLYFCGNTDFSAITDTNFLKGKDFSFFRKSGDEITLKTFDGMSAGRITFWGNTKIEITGNLTATSLQMNCTEGQTYYAEDAYTATVEGGTINLTGDDGIILAKSISVPGVGATNDKKAELVIKTNTQTDKVIKNIDTHSDTTIVIKDGYKIVANNYTHKSGTTPNVQNGGVIVEGTLIVNETMDLLANSSSAKITVESTGKLTAGTIASTNASDNNVITNNGTLTITAELNENYDPASTGTLIFDGAAAKWTKAAKVANVEIKNNTTITCANTITGDFTATDLGGKTLTVNAAQTIGGNLTLSGTDATHLLTVTGDGNGSFALPASQYGGSFLSVAENGPEIVSPNTYTAEHSEIAAGSSKAPDGWILSSTDMNVWLGGTTDKETDWATAANWSKGHVPVNTEVVYIPATANDPIISAAATCLDLVFAADDLLTVNNTLTIASDWTVTNIDTASTGTIKSTGKLTVPAITAAELSFTSKGFETTGEVTCKNVDSTGTNSTSLAIKAGGKLTTNNLTVTNGGTINATGFDLVIGGAAMFRGNVVANSLSVTGKTTLGLAAVSITTTKGQIYTGEVGINASDDITKNRDHSFIAGEPVVFNGPVKKYSTDAKPNLIIGNSTNPTNVTFKGTVNPGDFYNITVYGTATFDGPDSVTTVEAQTYNAIELKNNLTLTTTTAGKKITLGGDVTDVTGTSTCKLTIDGETSFSNDITITAAKVDFKKSLGTVSKKLTLNTSADFTENNTFTNLVVGDGTQTSAYTIRFDDSSTQEFTNLTSKGTEANKVTFTNKTGAANWNATLDPANATFAYTLITNSTATARLGITASADTVTEGVAGSTLYWFTSTYYWLGGTSSVWTEGTNWSLDGTNPLDSTVYPDYENGTDSIVVKASTKVLTIDAARKINSLTINENQKISFGNFDLTVAGTLTNNGTIEFTGSGRIYNADTTPAPIMDAEHGKVSYAGTGSAAAPTGNLTDYHPGSNDTADYNNLEITSGYWVIPKSGTANNTNIKAANSFTINSGATLVMADTSEINSELTNKGNLIIDEKAGAAIWANFTNDTTGTVTSKAGSSLWFANSCEAITDNGTWTSEKDDANSLAYGNIRFYGATGNSKDIVFSTDSATNEYYFDTSAMKAGSISFKGKDADNQMQIASYTDAADTTKTINFSNVTFLNDTTFNAELESEGEAGSKITIASGKTITAKNTFTLKQNDLVLLGTINCDGATTADTDDVAISLNNVYVNGDATIKASNITITGTVLPDVTDSRNITLKATGNTTTTGNIQIGLTSNPDEISIGSTALKFNKITLITVNKDITFEGSSNLFATDTIEVTGDNITFSGAITTDKLIVNAKTSLTLQPGTADEAGITETNPKLSLQAKSLTVNAAGLTDPSITYSGTIDLSSGTDDFVINHAVSINGHTHFKIGGNFTLTAAGSLSPYFAATPASAKYENYVQITCASSKVINLNNDFGANLTRFDRAIFNSPIVFDAAHKIYAGTTDFASGCTSVTKDYHYTVSNTLIVRNPISFPEDSIFIVPGSFYNTSSTSPVFSQNLRVNGSFVNYGGWTTSQVIYLTGTNNEQLFYSTNDLPYNVIINKPDGAGADAGKKNAVNFRGKTTVTDSKTATTGTSSFDFQTNSYKGKLIFSGTNNQTFNADPAYTYGDIEVNKAVFDDDGNRTGASTGTLTITNNPVPDADAQGALKANSLSIKNGTVKFTNMDVTAAEPMDWKTPDVVNISGGKDGDPVTFTTPGFHTIGSIIPEDGDSYFCVDASADKDENINIGVDDRDADGHDGDSSNNADLGADGKSYKLVTLNAGTEEGCTVHVSGQVWAEKYEIFCYKVSLANEVHTWDLTIHATDIAINGLTTNALTINPLVGTDPEYADIALGGAIILNNPADFVIDFPLQVLQGTFYNGAGDVIDDYDYNLTFNIKGKVIIRNKTVGSNTRYGSISSNADNAKRKILFTGNTTSLTIENGDSENLPAVFGTTAARTLGLAEFKSNLVITKDSTFNADTVLFSGTDVNITGDGILTVNGDISNTGKTTSGGNIKLTGNFEDTGTWSSTASGETTPSGTITFTGDSASTFKGVNTTVYNKVETNDSAKELTFLNNTTVTNLTLTKASAVKFESDFTITNLTDTADSAKIKLGYIDTADASNNKTAAVTISDELNKGTADEDKLLTEELVINAGSSLVIGDAATSAYKNFTHTAGTTTVDGTLTAEEITIGTDSTTTLITGTVTANSNASFYGSTTLSGKINSTGDTTIYGTLTTAAGTDNAVYPNITAGASGTIKFGAAATDTVSITPHGTAWSSDDNKLYLNGNVINEGTTTNSTIILASADVTNNGELINIATITVTGNFENTGTVSGTDENAILNLKGNFTDTGIWHSAETLILNGTGTQDFTPTETTYTDGADTKASSYKKIVIEKSDTATGDTVNFTAGKTLTAETVSIKENETTNFNGKLSVTTLTDTDKPGAINFETAADSSIETAAISTTGTVTLSGELTLTNDSTLSNITIAATGVLNGTADKSITITSSWTNNHPYADDSDKGGYIPNGGTIILAPSGTSLTIAGDTIFNNLTCDESAATEQKTILFTAGSTQTVNGTLLLTGKEGQLLKLNSTTEGTAWNIKAKNHEVTYVDLKDSYNNNSDPQDANYEATLYAENSDNSGNNKHWNFPGMEYIWEGTTSNDWYVDSNWNKNSVPGLGAKVKIPQGLAKPYPVLSADVNLNGTHTFTKADATTVEKTYTGEITIEPAEITGDVVTKVQAELDLADKNLTAGTITNNGLVKLRGVENQTVTAAITNGTSSTVEYYGGNTETFAWGKTEDADHNISYSFNKLLISDAAAVSEVAAVADITVINAATKNVSLTGASTFTKGLDIAAAGAVTLNSKNGFTLTQSAASFTSLEVQSKVTIDSDITTTAEQTYKGSVTAAAKDVTFTAGADKLIKFESTVTGTKDTTTEPATLFNLTIATANAEFDDDVSEFKEIAVEGTTLFNKASAPQSIETSETQTYSKAVTIIVPAINIKASKVTFTSTVDSADKSQALAITGKAEFNEKVGGTNELSTLSVSNAATIKTTAISTTGNQTYKDTVEGNTTNDVTLTGTTVSFSKDVSKIANLTVDADISIADSLQVSATKLTLNKADTTPPADAAIQSISAATPGAVLTLDVTTLQVSQTANVTSVIDLAKALEITNTNSKVITFNAQTGNSNYAITNSGSVTFNNNAIVSPVINNGTITCTGDVTFQNTYSTDTGKSGNFTGSTATVTFNKDVDFSNTTFTHNSGTVKLIPSETELTLTGNSAAGQDYNTVEIHGSVTLTSKNTFANLKAYNKSVTTTDPGTGETTTTITPSTIIFPAGSANVQTVTNSLILTGNKISDSDIKYLTLKSSSAASDNTTDCFYINFTGTISEVDDETHDYSPLIQYVNMQNGYNCTGEPATHTYLTVRNAEDSGNNYYWNFPGLEYIWTGEKDTNWFERLNWNRKSIPGFGANVKINELTGATPKYPLLETNVDVGKFDSATDPRNGKITIAEKALVDFAGYNCEAYSITNNGTAYLTGVTGQKIEATNSDAGTVVYYGSSIATSAWGTSYYNLVFADGTTIAGVSHEAASGEISDSITVNGTTAISGNEADKGIILSGNNTFKKMVTINTAGDATLSGDNTYAGIADAADVTLNKADAVELKVASDKSFKLTEALTAPDTVTSITVTNTVELLSDITTTGFQTYNNNVKLSPVAPAEGIKLSTPATITLKGTTGDPAAADGTTGSAYLELDGNLSFASTAKVNAKYVKAINSTAAALTWNTAAADTTANIATDLFVDAPSKDFNFDGMMAVRNFYFYNGKLAIAAHGTSDAIKTSGDFVVFGSEAASYYDDPRYTGADTRFAYAGTPLYTDSTYSAEFGTTTDAILNIGNNFYVNKADLADVTLKLPAKTGTPVFNSGAAATATQWGTPYAVVFNSELTNITSSNWLTAATSQGNTDNGGNTNIQFDVPKIEEAYTVYDDVVYLKFTMPVENADGKINVNLAAGTTLATGGAWYNGAANRFSATAYADADCTTPLPNGNVQAFYLKAADGNGKWNTDADGSYAYSQVGTTAAADSTDRSGTHRNVTVDLSFLEGMFTAAEGYTMCNNYGNTGLNEKESDPHTYEAAVFYTDTADHCSPVLLGVYAGQEDHKEDLDAQEFYDSHNFIELRYSEPVNISDGTTTIAAVDTDGITAAGENNIHATDTLGHITGSGTGSGITPAGSEGLTVAGLVSLNKGKLNAGNKADSSSPHSLYRTFATSCGAAPVIQTHRVRIAIAGYVEEDPSATFHNWLGYIDYAKAPAADTTAVPAANADLKDLSGNSLVITGTTNHPIAESFTLNSGVPAGNIYGTWDTSAPLFTPIRKIKDTTVSDFYEAIPTGNGTSITNIELHLLDGDYEDSQEYFVFAYGWSRPVAAVNADDDKYALINDMFHAADRFGGSRPFAMDATRTGGGIRYSSIVGQEGSFKYSPSAGATPSIAFEGIDTGATSSLFSGSSGAVQPIPTTKDNPYLSLGISSYLYGYDVQFSVSYDNSSSYITDLAGNRLRSTERPISTIDRTPPDYDISLGSIGTKELYVVFVKNLKVSNISVGSHQENSLYDILPKIVEFGTIPGSGSQFTTDSSLYVTASELYEPFTVRAEQNGNNDFTAFKLTLNREITTTDVKSLYMRIKAPEGDPETAPDPFSGVSGSRVTFIQDDMGISYLQMYKAHPLSDFAINAINPEYAYAPDYIAEDSTLIMKNPENEEESGSWAVHSWGQEQYNYGTLPHGMKINLIASVPEVQNFVMYMSNSPTNGSVSEQFNKDFGVSKRIWLPAIAGTDPFKSFANVLNTNFYAVTDQSAINPGDLDFDTGKFPNRVEFKIDPAGNSYNWSAGNQISFLFALSNGSTPLKLMHNPTNDAPDSNTTYSGVESPIFAVRTESVTAPEIGTMDLWSFKLKDFTYQRGGVSIFNNVINVYKGEKTVIKVTMPSAGNLKVVVMTLDGNVIDYLENTNGATAGDHVYYWNGTNRSGNQVARGMYFIRVIGEGLDETRKVLCVNEK